jgi:predicted acetyltransferase
LSTDWLQEAAADLASFVARRRTVREQWGVPVTCAVDNLGSRRVIEANGGAPDRIVVQQPLCS